MSRLLFDAREIADMYATVIRGDEQSWPARLRSEIDAFRAEQGWSAHGYGGEGTS